MLSLPRGVVVRIYSSTFDSFPSASRVTKRLIASYWFQDMNLDYLFFFREILPNFKCDSRKVFGRQTDRSIESK